MRARQPGMIFVAVVLVAVCCLWVPASALTRSGPVQYIALGDSIPAGDGLPRLRSQEALSCHRSAGGYPFLLARRPLLDLACSGATTANVLSTSQRTRDGSLIPLQLSQTAGARPTLVTITIGLNDLGFDAVVRACLTPPSSGTSTWVARCRREGSPVARGLRAVRANLGKILDAILRVRPRPTMLVTGYYDLWPAPDDVSRCSVRHHDLSSLVFSAAIANGNLGRLRQWEGQLNSVLAAVAKEHRVTFVSLRDVFVGHKLCSRDEWVFYPSPANQKNLSALHPTAQGQRRIADLLLHATSS